MERRLCNDGFSRWPFFAVKSNGISANSSKKKLNIIWTFFHVLASFLRRSWSYRDSIRVQKHRVEHAYLLVRELWRREIGSHMRLARGARERDDPEPAHKAEPRRFLWAAVRLGHAP